MTELSLDQERALAIAHTLVDMGVPIFSAPRNHSVDLTARMPFLLPDRWQEYKPNHLAVDRWRPGWMLGMVTGVVFDVIDIDPRNGGWDGYQELLDAEAVPLIYGQQDTPSGGQHLLIARTHLAKGKPAQGIDLQAGEDDGNGRGFIYLAPTERIARGGPNEGQPVAYLWTRPPVAMEAGDDYPALDRLIELAGQKRSVRRSATMTRPAAQEPEDEFVDEAGAWLPSAAAAAVAEQLARVEAAQIGEVNPTLGGAARVLGRFVAGGWLDYEAAAADLLTALEVGGVHSDEWNATNGVGWSAAGVIASAFTNAEAEPWRVEDMTEIVRPEVDITARVDIGFPRLLVQSTATMAYWLATEVGREKLAGFFTRGGQIVHTPRVTELGYVPAPEGDENGVAEIRPVSGRVMASKIQFLYACYKMIKVKGEEDREVPAMFPIGAAEAVVNAPEAATGLRPLKGITHTPMVRQDGTVLADPGYDKGSGYLFVPEHGVSVPMVPDAPSLAEVQSAVTLVMEMIEGFPFATDADRANYLGLLLTPLLRQVCPPPYKMFGISAHQPGSGKSLLAEIVAMIHGAVMRSEVPVDEAEWGKQTSSILATTSSPVVVLDNVTGVLKSSTLAGLLTSSGEQTARELGKSTNLTYVNDRVWCVTGNNLSLGGDLVRRTITVLIDPDMANPETRTDFRIKDLPAWVKVNRNRLLHALLVIIRHWASCGMPLEDRQQSDGFTTWERAVGGILTSASIAGAFDARSGQRVAAGGDDEGLATVLDRMSERWGEQNWTVGTALLPDADSFAEADRDWLPAAVLDKFTRGEARGKQAFGNWLKFRVGRWVTTWDGRALVLRDKGRTGGKQHWAVEAR